MTNGRHQSQTDEQRVEKPVLWVGSSLEDLKQFPKPVRQLFGQALFDAQRGQKHPDAKPLKGFGGAGVLEIIEDERGSAYRAVYTVRFSGVVYVLHAFQKKSKVGSKTPPRELAKIKSRLEMAEKHYAERKRQKSETDD